jgi:flagellar biosynthesis GTPase FlhF
MKYTGSYTPADDVKQSREFLATLEAQLAASFSKASGIEYLDRSNLDALFREQRLETGDAFNPSSGALRGLLGKLDYLLVIEASGPKQARLRIIDVETGAVKGATVCQKGSSLLDLLSSSKIPECISSLVDKSLSLAKDRLALKRARAIKEANEQRDAENKRAGEEQKRMTELHQAEKQRADEQRRAEVRLAAQRAETEREAKAEEQRRQQVEAEASRVRPRYEDTISRVSSEDQFWGEMDAQLRATGHSLRPEIRSAWNAVDTRAVGCGALLDNLRAADANNCLDQIDKQLEQLDKYK